MGYFVIGLFYLIGFGLLGYSLSIAYRSTKAASWPTTPGKITQLDLHVSHGRGTTYEVRVKYDYMVNGAVYEGNRVAFGYGGSSGKEAHDELYDRLKDAKGIEIRYNPTNPSESCLSCGLHRSITAIFAFAIFWLGFIIGITILIFLFSDRDDVLLQNLLVQ